MSAPDRPIVAADGRAMGPRARATRQRLLDATEDLIERMGVRDVTVVDITRQIGAAPATFYQYFSDIDSSILALAEDAVDDVKSLLVHLDPVWSQPRDVERARRFVTAYLDHWKARHAALRVANLRAEEGDERFRRVRVRAYLVIVDQMIAIVETGQRAGRIAADLDAYSAAVSCEAMLERLMSYETSPRRRHARQALDFDTVARMLFHTLSGFPA